MDAPKDRGKNEARVYNLDDYRKKSSPGPAHPASRAMEKKETKTEAQKDKEFSDKFDVDV